MSEYLRYVKTVDPEMPLVNKVQLAAQLGLELNVVDEIIDEERKWIEQAATVAGCEAPRTGFAGGYLLSIKADYVSRRGWDEWMALREFLQNALDTEELIGFGYLSSWVYVADRGPGVPPSKAMFFGASEKDLCRDRGVFGEGMKMGLLTLENKGMPAVVVTNVGALPIAYKYKILDDGRVIMLVYVLDGVRCSRGELSEAISLTGTVVLVYDPGKAIESRVKDYGMDSLADAITPVKKVIGVSEFYAPPESGFRCTNVGTNYLLKDTTALYVRGIFVRPEMPGYVQNKLGYDMWWFYLDPNRNNVDTSKTNVGRTVIEFYSNLEPAPGKEEEFYRALVDVVKRGAKCTLVAGTTNILHLHADTYESIGVLFMSPEHARKVLDKVGEELCGIPVSLFKATLYKPSPVELATYAHYVAKPALSIESPPYFVTEEEVMARLSQLGLQDAKDAIRDEIVNKMHDIRYDPTKVPDAEIIQAAFEELAGMLINEEVKVIIGGKRSFSVPESNTIVIEESLVKVDIAGYQAREAIATFLHELAHVYAYIMFGVADDLTEQHVYAIQKLGAMLALSEKTSRMARAIEQYLKDHVDVYMNGVTCLGNSCTFEPGTTIHRIVYVPRTEIGLIYQEYGKLPSFTALYMWNVKHPQGEQFLKALYSGIYTPRSIVEIPVLEPVEDGVREVLGRIVVMNACLDYKITDEEAKESCIRYGTIPEEVFEEAEEMVEKMPLKELERGLRIVRSKQKKLREKYYGRKY